MEDVPTDAELILNEISKNGINFSHILVETKKEYIEALISFTPDLIISGYLLSQFDGRNALSLRNEMAPQTPFILVTGEVNEEIAVELMKAGADDYILKTNLVRLIPSIKSSFEKRDEILIRLLDESELRNNYRQYNTDKNAPLVKKNTNNTGPGENNLKEYDLIEENQILLNLAMNSAGIGTWVFDLVSGQRYFDKKSCQLLGFEPVQYGITEKEFMDRIHPYDRKEFKTLLNYALSKKSNFEIEFRVTWPEGKVKFLTLKTQTIFNNQGLPVRMDGFIWDITEQKLLQITLQENLRKTSSIITNLNGAVFRCKYDAEMTMEYISEGVKQTTGYPSWDFLMNRVRSYASIINEEDRENVKRKIRNALEKKIPYTVDYRIKSATGGQRWISERGHGVFAGDKTIALEGLISDITDMKKTEKQINKSLKQLQQLNQYIHTVREKERVLLSRELHDDLGQALTAVMIDLGSLKKIIPDEEKSKLKIDKISALVNDTIKTVQRLTSQLRPQIIDDLGLEAAVEWYAKDFSERTGITILIKLEPVGNITSDVSLIIFRILQEALTNIARHSKAKKVVIKLFVHNKMMRFEIADNGIGINEKAIKSRNSFGLISMRERAKCFGGVLKIDSPEEGGTKVSLFLPIILEKFYENSDL